jgi:hypothetical protein
MYVRFRRVGCQIDLVNLQEIVLWIIAKLQRIVTGYRKDLWILALGENLL